MKEFALFDEFIRSKGLRHTSQRDNVLKVFLETEKHVSVDELYHLVRKQYPGIGYTTVYRTMRLLSDCGLCRGVDLGDGILKFEHEYGHTHHDHLICTECDGLIEVLDPEIEKLQEAMARKHSFTPLRHKLEIFGICKKCSSRS